MMPEREYAPQPSVQVGLAGRCPRCGQGKVFAGLTKVAPRCGVCGLDFVDPGDGAAMFVILIGNVVILGAALWLEFTYSPPLWLHVILWPPISIAFCILSLRLIKGVLVALQYRHRAAEGRLEP
jgi:uncharacterized protein (DUF983 family)